MAGTSPALTSGLASVTSTVATTQNELREAAVEDRTPLSISRRAYKLLVEECSIRALTMPAIVLLMLLGITSNKRMVRRLGKNWAKLHKTIYWVAGLAWIHVLLQVRSSYTDAVLFGTLTLILLGIRLYWRLKIKP